MPIGLTGEKARRYNMCVAAGIRPFPPISPGGGRGGVCPWTACDASNDAEIAYRVPLLGQFSPLLTRSPEL